MLLSDPQAKITRALAAREQKQRKRNLTKYIPNAAAAIFSVLDAMAHDDQRTGAAGGASSSQGGPKRRRLVESEDVLERVRKHEVCDFSYVGFVV